MHSGRKALSQSNLRTLPLTFMNFSLSTASEPSLNLTALLLSLILPIGTGYCPEMSIEFSTSTESFSTAAGESPSCVYTKIFLSNLPGCPLGLYVTITDAFSPGSTIFFVHMACAQEHVETSLLISSLLRPTLVNSYVKVFGASSSVIRSATICLITNDTDAESLDS